MLIIIFFFCCGDDLGLFVICVVLNLFDLLGGLRIESELLWWVEEFG